MGSGAFAGPNKWVLIRLFWLEGTIIFVIFSLIFFPLLFNAIFIPSWIPCGAIINISIPLYLKDKHQKVAAGKDFHECKIRFGLLSKGEDFLLGFTNIVEITPDWSDARLKRFQNSREFMTGLQSYLTRIIVQDFHAKRLGMKDMKALINELKGLPKEKKKETLPKVKKSIVKGNEKIKQSQEKNEIQAKNDIENAIKEQKKKIKKNPQYKLKDLPFSYLNINDLSIDKNELGKCHIYVGLLYEEETREGHTIPFDRVVIISEDPKEVVLETQSMEAYDKDDYPIDIKGVQCYYLCVRWILDKIPVLYLRWSENMVTRDIMTIKSPEIMDYIDIKVMEELLFHKSDDGRQAALKIDRLEAQYEGAADELSDAVQDIWEYRNWGFGNRLGDQRNVMKAELKTKKWKMIAGVIIVIFTFLFVFMLFFNINSGATVPPPI